MSFDWKGLIGDVAPYVSTALSGINPLAGAAASILSKAFLGKDEGTKAEVEEHVAAVIQTGDSEKIAELKARMQQAEIDFKKSLQDYGIKMESLDVRREEIASGDRSNARDMQKTALATDDKFARRFVYWYAIGLTTLSFIYFFTVTFVKINDDQKDMANIILGFLLGTGLATVIAFFYGTTHGTLSKNKQIEALALQVPPKGV